MIRRKEPDDGFYKYAAIEPGIVYYTQSKRELSEIRVDIIVDRLRFSHLADQAEWWVTYMVHGPYTRSYHNWLKNNQNSLRSNGGIKSRPLSPETSQLLKQETYKFS